MPPLSCPRALSRSQWESLGAELSSQRPLHTISTGKSLDKALSRLATVRKGRRSYATVVEETVPPKHPYPYPSCPSPSAHEIFHLKPGATQAQIKARYYELVRCHHPDSHHCRLLPPDVAHTRFQSVTAAYDFLRGKTSSHKPGAKAYGFNSGSSNFDPYLHELARRRRAQQAAHGQTHWHDGFGAHREERNDNYNQDGTRERTMLAFGVLAFILGLYPSLVLFPFQLEKAHKSAVFNLTQARNDAREMGNERRTEIRKRVQDMQQQRSERSIDGEPFT